MSDPVWTPVLGDIGTPGSANALATETAARIAADTALLGLITAIPPAGVSSVFGRVGAIVKAAGDYNFSDLGTHPTDLAGYGITDAYTKAAADARYAPIAVPWASITGTPTTLATYGITDAYTKTASDARFSPLVVPWASITGTPTTIAGYGISDAYTKALSDARFFRDIPVLGSDTFPQAASTALALLGTGQSWVMWNGAWVTTGANQAKENASVRDAAVVWDTGLTEQDWSIYMSSTNGGIGKTGAIVRGVSAGNYIFVQWFNGALTINKMVAGVATQLATTPASGPAASIVFNLRVTVTGNTITAFLNGPASNPGTAVGFTLTGGDATFFVGTFVGLYLTATGGTNAGYLYSNVAFRNYLNTQATLDARYVRLDVVGQTIAPNAPVNQNVISLTVGTQANQSSFKSFGQILIGNNNDALQNSTGSGFLHVASFSGVTLGLTNGTVHLKAIAAGISSPVAPFIQTTGGAPALATSTGVVGQFAWDSGNLYICIAANTWKRVAVATF